MVAIICLGELSLSFVEINRSLNRSRLRSPRHNRLLISQSKMLHRLLKRSPCLNPTGSKLLGSSPMHPMPSANRVKHTLRLVLHSVDLNIFPSLLNLTGDIDRLRMDRHWSSKLQVLLVACLRRRALTLEPLVVVVVLGRGVCLCSRRGR